MDEMQAMLANAIENFDVELARILIIENDVVPKNVDEDAMLLFIQNAVILNDKPLLQQLIKYNRRLSGRFLWTVLDNIELATLFVSAGADLNVTQSDLSTSTFLHVLLANQDPSKIKLAELIIDMGANISAVDDFGHTVLQSAIRNGASMDFIRKLIWNSVADFETNAIAIAESNRCAELMPVIFSFIMVNPESNKTVLKNTDLGGKMLWYVLDSTELSTKLIQSGANLNIRRDDDSKETFLHVLSVSNDPSKIKLAEMMIDRNADVSAVDRNERSVLQCAINAGAPKDFISLLLWKTINHFEKNTITIADSKRSEELLPVLVNSIMNNSIDAITRSRHVKDAIFSLIDHPAIKIAESRRKAIAYLLRHALPVNMFDSRVYAFLSEAIVSRNHDLLEVFFQNGADPNGDKYKEVPLLWFAAKMEESSMAITLIKYGADVNSQSSIGVRPIHGACQSSSINNLLLLIRLGAHVNVIDDLGQTPLTLLSETESWLESNLLNIIIRRLALEVAQGTKFNPPNMGLIPKFPILPTLFDSCMDELKRMKEMEIVEGIPYFNFLVENVEKTSKYVRRNDLINVSGDDKFISKLEKLFPYYNNDFRDAYNFAEALQHLVMEKEQLVNGIISELYQITLPDVVISKIVNYLCFDEELKRYILEFHSSTFK